MLEANEGGLLYREIRNLPVHFVGHLICILRIKQMLICKIEIYSYHQYTSSLKC